ncbi:MAG: hypothetical protein JNK74_13605 [Candidatus Hydrogenedentes bacterium]|nr:hypothetical protein [Candidatus Hydrogenedentota bacterium]
MEKNWKIELSDQVQMFVWTIGLVVIFAFMIWDRIDGGGRSFEKDGVTGLFFLTNLNIVLNRISFRNAMRKKDADT